LAIAEQFPDQPNVYLMAERQMISCRCTADIFLRHQLDDRDARHELSDSNWSSPGYPLVENFAIQLTVGPPAPMSGIGQVIRTSVGPLTLLKSLSAKKTIDFG